MINQREIKFRAWDLTKKRWDNIHTDYSKSKGAERYFEIDKEFIRFNRGDIILQQFTGLKDKNGKEIYEGDIVKYNWTISDKAEVVWDDVFLRWSGKVNKQFIPFAGREWKQFEVIGNIYEGVLLGYENPELLKN